MDCQIISFTCSNSIQFNNNLFCLEFPNTQGKEIALEKCWTNKSIVNNSCITNFKIGFWNLYAPKNNSLHLILNEFNEPLNQSRGIKLLSV